MMTATEFANYQKEFEANIEAIFQLEAEIAKHKEKPRLLELFKGTGSIGKIATDLGYEVTSLDILAKYKPTIVSDILEWDYKQYEPHHFDCIWSSPECKIFSPLQRTHVKKPNKTYKRKMKWSSMDELIAAQQENGKFVHRVLEIIEYFKPKQWFIENPWQSAMKDLDFMKDIPSYRFDYCRFGYEYNKPTRIWTNKKLEDMTCMCKTKHKFRIGISSKKLMGSTLEADATSLDQRYSIPPALVRHLLED